MKRMITACVFLAGITVVCAAQSDSVAWVPQQSGVHVTLWQVRFSDTLHGWACGDAGTLLRTSDGGQHWQKSTAFTARTIDAVSFINNATGWLVTDTAQVYKSTDSGATWTLQYFPPRTSFSDCLFFDDSTGFVSGSDMNGANMYNEGVLYKTVNGGSAWTLAQSYMITVWDIASLCFPDKRHGWATGADYLLRTTDSARTWQAPVSFYSITDSAFIKTAGYVNRIVFLDTLRGFGIGRNGHIIRTRDGGASWSLVEKISEWPEGISFADPQRGVIVGQGGAVLTSADSGAGWDLRYPRPQAGAVTVWFRDVVFLDKDHGWLAGDSGVIMRGRFYTPSTAAARRGPDGRPMDGISARVAPPGMLTVSFTVREAGPGEIDLCDLRGRAAALLWKGRCQRGAFAVTVPVGSAVRPGGYVVMLRQQCNISYEKAVIVR